MPVWDGAEQTLKNQGSLVLPAVQNGTSATGRVPQNVSAEHPPTLPHAPVGGLQSWC